MWHFCFSTYWQTIQISFREDASVSHTKWILNALWRGISFLVFDLDRAGYSWLHWTLSKDSFWVYFTLAMCNLYSAWNRNPDAPIFYGTIRRASTANVSQNIVFISMWNILLETLSTLCMCHEVTVNAFVAVATYRQWLQPFRGFKLPQRCEWDLRSSGMLRSLGLLHPWRWDR